KSHWIARCCAAAGVAVMAHALGRGIATPRICVEERIPQVLEHRSMKVAAAAFGHDPDDASRSSAVLGGISSGQDLHLRRGISVSDTDTGAVSPAANHRRAIEGHAVFATIGAVDVDPVVEAKVEIRNRRTTTNAWLQLRQVHGIATVELNRLDLLLRDQLAYGGGLCLEDVRICDDIYGGVGTAYLKGGIDAKPNARFQLIVLAGDALKAWSL